MGIKSNLVIPSVVAMWKGGDDITEDRIIVKSDTIPEASADTYKKMYCYSGETNSAYTHGYIYECKGTEELSIPIVYFDPGKMAFDYTKATHPYKTFSSDADAMYKFLSELLQIENPTDVVSGQATVVEDTIVDDHEHYEMWNIYCKDKDGNDVLTDVHKIYASDMQAYGFEFAYPAADYHENEPIDFNFKWQKNVTDLHWERIDVQPSSGGGGTSDYADLSNKPSINSVTLSGNKTSNDLGVASNDLGNLTDNSKVNLTNILSNIYKSAGYDIVGSPTIVDGIASGFSLDNYVETSGSVFDLSKKWEIDLHITRPTSTITNTNFIFGGRGKNFIIQLLTNGKITFSIDDKNGDTKYGFLDGDEDSTTTYFKLKYDDVEKQLTTQKSSNGETYTTQQTISIECGGSIPSFVYGSGGLFGYNQYYEGSIDLKNSLIKSDDKLWAIENSNEVKPAHLAMPSDVTEDLTVVQGTIYTAPADGYLQIATSGSCNISTHVANATVTDWTTIILNTYLTMGSNNCTFIPVRKGQKFSSEWSGTLQHFYFVYAKGSETEYQGA